MTRALAVLGISLMALFAAIGGSSAVLAQPAEPLPPPLEVVEGFLLARDAGDYFGAAGWCVGSPRRTTSSA
jgi:hypothetical protein